jgi:hypothetical protein
MRQFIALLALLLSIGAALPAVAAAATSPNDSASYQTSAGGGFR